jgi:predicted nucleic acid-binding protein
MDAPHADSTDAAPVVVAAAPLRALASIRHERLLPEMFGRVAICRSVAEATADLWPTRPPWLDVHDDVEVDLPPRLVHVEGDDRATLQLSVHLNASLTIIDGKPLLEKVKLSFLKAMGTVPLLVQAYQEGRIRAVKPLLVALERKGHDMPPPEQMAALLRALDSLR